MNESDKIKWRRLIFRNIVCAIFIYLNSLILKRSTQTAEALFFQWNRKIES